MEHPEVPLEQTQEDMMHHAHAATEQWVLGVALTAALLAVCAAVTSLLAEHHANEAMIDQIQCSDQWNYYQAKGVKAGVLTTKIDLLKALGKTPQEEDLKKLDKYAQDQEEIKAKAEAKQEASEAHLRHHTGLAQSVTMFQVAIAVGAISVLTKRPSFWFACLGFGLAGVVLLLYGLLVG
jgi:hypothetical protein